MDRQQRHDLKHDKFVDEIGVLSQKARENQRGLLYLAGGLLAIAVIVYGIFFYRANREEEAQESLATAIETFDAPVGEVPAGQQPTTGPRFKTEPEKIATAEKQFKDVQAKYGSSDAADVAGLYLARIVAARGDTKTARPLLEKFIKDQKDHILVSAARFSLYQMRIEGGEAGQAAIELNAELGKADPVLPGDALLVLLAQAYENQGDATRSREAYRRITTEFPESPYAAEAQKHV
jgi:tetratricopeptide (TPR) repeat protein